MSKTHGEYQLWRDVRDGLRAQPGRAGLSLLAIAVGMVALTVLLAVLGGLRARAAQLGSDFHADVFAIVSGGRRGDLARQDVDALRAGLGPGVVSGVRNDAMRGPDEASIAVLASDGRLRPARGWGMAAGRFLDDRDEQQAARNAVVSVALGARYGWTPGTVVRVHGVPFTVVGIVRSTATPLNTGPGPASGDLALFVPWTSARHWCDSADELRRVDVVYAAAGATARLAGAVERARRLVDGRAPGRSQQLQWVTQDVILEGVRRLERVIVWTAGAVACLCLLLGGTTMMSLMVANVRDRVVEIGLRRALGALPGDVAALFVAEALVLTAGSAVVASGFTHLALRLAAGRLTIPLQLNLASFLWPVAIAMLLGALFAYWPARLAARISPADALRAE